MYLDGTGLHVRSAWPHHQRGTIVHHGGYFQNCNCLPFIPETSMEIFTNVNIFLTDLKYYIKSTKEYRNSKVQMGAYTQISNLYTEYSDKIVLTERLI